MVKDVILTGKFEGDLKTLGCLTVASGGVIVGTIDAGALVLEPGNRVEARVKVGPPAKSALRAAEEKRRGLEDFWPRSFRMLKEFALGRR